MLHVIPDQIVQAVTAAIMVSVLMVPTVPGAAAVQIVKADIV